MSSTDPDGDGTPERAAERPVRRRPAGGAPILSLEERKAQRQREREAARAARVASLAAPDGARTDPSDAEPPAERPRPRAPLGGVRPAEGLGGPGAGPLPAAAGALAAPAALAAAAAAPRLRGPGPDAPRPVPPGAVRAAPAAAVRATPEPAGLAQPRARHWGVALSFALVVLLPTLLSAWYLWERASPRFASYAGFTVRTEETASAVELLGGVAALAGSTTNTDSDVLYEFFQSQDIVARVDDRLDLRALWAKGDAERDPVFAYHAPGTIEDLHDYWMRMVSVYTDGSTGLIDIEVQAFDPDDAQAIARVIYEEGTILINRLSEDAQAQATRYAEEDLIESVDRLKVARAALTRFRNETQIVDPATAVQSQMGLMSQLESELAQTLIDLDLLRQTAPGGDPRIAQAEARVGVIEARMEAERAKLGAGAAGGEEGAPAFADLVGEYEGLLVDQEFAEAAYAAARTAYDAALGDARRESRYLAVHVQPTLAERAEYPSRLQLTLLTGLFAFLAWAILTLAIYAARDRR